MNKSKKDNANTDKNNSNSENNNNNKNKKDLMMKFLQNIHLKTIRFKKFKDQNLL